jgi:hypothetical protein
MRNLLATIGVGICLAALAVPAAARKKKKKEKKSNPAAVALFEKAIAASDIEAKSAPAFRLQATARIFGAHGKHADAVLVQFWEPTGQWREETMMGGYNLVRVFDGQRQWAKGTLTYVPFPVYELWAALGFRSRLRRQIGQKPKVDLSLRQVTPASFHPPAGKKKPVLTKPKRRGNLECVEDKGLIYLEGQFCFDAASGHLVSERDRATGLRYEYSDYAAFGQKSFPRFVRVFYKAKNELLEIHVSRIDPVVKPSPALFIPAKGSEEQFSPGCGKTSQAKLMKLTKKALPKYPRALLQEEVEGSVVLYAYIAADGVPEGLWPLRTPSPQLTDSAIAAVRQWRYKPWTCESAGGVHAVPIPIYVTIVFTIGQ